VVVVRVRVGVRVRVVVVVVVVVRVVVVRDVRVVVVVVRVVVVRDVRGLTSFGLVGLRSLAGPVVLAFESGPALGAVAVGAAGLGVLLRGLLGALLGKLD